MVCDVGLHLRGRGRRRRAAPGVRPRQTGQTPGPAPRRRRNDRRATIGSRLVCSTGRVDSRLSVGHGFQDIKRSRGIHVRIVAGRRARSREPGRGRLESGFGGKTVAVRVRRNAHGEFLQDSFILHRRARPPDAPPALAFDRIAALDATLSDYQPESELSRLSLTAGGPPVAVSADLFDVLERSKQFHARTGGVFDVTIAPVGRLWRRARRDRKLPDPQKARRGPRPGRLRQAAPGLEKPDRPAHQAGHEARRRRHRQGICLAGGHRRASGAGNHPRPGRRGRRHRRRRPAAGRGRLDHRHRRLEPLGSRAPRPTSCSRTPRSRPPATPSGS